MVAQHGAGEDASQGEGDTPAAGKKNEVPMLKFLENPKNRLRISDSRS